MRIRKHAKMSNSLLLSDSVLLKSHIICQLNQSPWDIISFPPPSPPPYQFDGNDISYNGNGNGSLADSLGAIESVGSMKDEETDSKVEEREEKRRGANLCCNTDGKQRQCKREAQKRHTLCDYHLAQIKNYNTLAHPSIAKSAASNRPTRARKATTIAPSNPNDFYYYSGFGPRWGKKRDIAGTSITQKRERESVEPIKTVPIPPYSSSEIDEDEEDEEKCGIGKKKKKRRKPIKARSLKDLCEVMG